MTLNSDVAVSGASASAAGNLRPVRRRFDWTVLIWGTCAAILIFLVINPVARLVLSSFEVIDGVGYTFDNYLAAFGRWRHVQALLNTLVMATGVSILAGLFAVPLAWATVRTDMPGRTFVRLGVLAAFITPPYLGAVGWILLAGPNAGWLNKLYMAATGADAGILNIFSLGGLILIMAGNLYFFIFVTTSTALELVSSEMEDAANMLGANALKTAFKITLPLVYPAIIGGLILVFLQAIALFGVPALIAIPARYPVVTTQLWQFFESPVRAEVAAAYALPLLAITISLLALQRRLLAGRGYATVGGKGGERRVVKLGIWRWPMFLYALLVMGLSVLMPLVVLFQASLSKSWGRGFTAQNFTLSNFKFVLFEHAGAQKAIVNSVLYGGAAALASLTLALCIAYMVKRRIVRGAGVLAFLCMTPFVIPGLVLAIGFYAAYTTPPLSLAGTAAIVILAFTTRLLPIAYMNSASGIDSIHPEMEEAARILGSSRAATIRRIVAPLLKRSLVGAWILVFIPACQELSTAIFLTGPNTRVMSMVMLDFSEEGRLEQLAALGGILLVITIAIVVLGFRIVGRDFMLRRA
jgi:iron(III) transport system permease protein